MSYSYNRYETRRRRTSGTSTRGSGWGYWIPLAITVTVATAGIAAWIWNERRREDEEEEHSSGSPPQGPPPQGKPPPGHAGPAPDPGYEHPPGAGNPPPQDYGSPPGGFNTAPTSDFVSAPPAQTPYGGAPGNREMEEDGIFSRMSEALRRTSSPQQIIDVASRRVAAGVAAAGAAVGGALASIREEDRKDYEDHSRWSEEAGSQDGTLRKRPEMRDAEAATSVRREQTGSKPSSARKTVAIVVSAETIYEHQEDSEYHQEDAARAIVEKATMIMPFTTPTGFVHLLRHLGPEVVYLQATLAGSNGEHMDPIKNWVGQTVIVVGDESGHGGLVDSEDERAEIRNKWWLEDSRIGLGKGVEIVEGLRVGEDFKRRVGGHD
ncbi:MAG: hypothetical protein Q9163_001144 [Psora crenata]